MWPGCRVRFSEYVRTFDQLLEAFAWKEIRGCPGRFVLVEAQPWTTPPTIAGAESVVIDMTSRRCRDPIELVVLAGGGALLSYRRPDGTYRHTLNTAAGLARKLAQLEAREIASP